MISTELLKRAARYRAVAQTLPPNLPGPQNKAYYIAQAEQLEAQALEIPKPVPAIPPRPAPSVAVASALTLPKQTKIHSRLAYTVAGDKRPHIHRAFSIWATIRTNGQAHYDFTEVLKFYAAETGNSERNVRRWLAAGDGLFWTFGRKNRLSIHGKNRVFQQFNMVLPGRVLPVDTEALTGQLKRLRAALYACFVNKSSKWASRDTLQQITGVHPRTQLNYDHTNKQHKQSTYALGYELPTSDSTARQLPNRYYPRFYPAYSGRKNDRRYRLYSSEINGAITPTDDTEGGRRLLYDNPNQAIETAKRRGKLGIEGNCFTVLPGPATKRGHLLLKPVHYAA